MNSLSFLLLGALLHPGGNDLPPDSRTHRVTPMTAQCPAEVEWNPEHYDVDLRIDYGHERLDGRVSVTLRNRTGEPQARVPLLLYRLMQVDSVEGAGSGSLEFDQQVETYADYRRLQVNVVQVSLPAPVPPEDTVQVVLHYGGYLLGMSEAFRYVKETIDPAFTLIRDDSNAYPTIGYPCHKANVKRPLNLWSYDARISVPDSLVVANGGNLVSRNSEGGNATYHYTSKVPSWRMDFAIAPYKEFTSGKNVVFALPDDADSAGNILKAMDETLELYTRWFGPLRAFGGLAVIEIPEGFGSQTDVTAIIQTADAFKDPKRLHEFYHELSHQWNVKATDDHPPRIEEGLAVFLESLTVEELEGRTYLDSYMDILLNYIRRVYRDHPEYASASLSEFGERGFEGMSYTVGAVFFRLLYAELGADAFRSVMRDLYAERSESGATIDDMMGYFRAEGGAKVDHLIDDWVYGTRYSDLISDGKGIKDLLALYAPGWAKGWEPVRRSAPPSEATVVNPWLDISAADYVRHMDHDSVRQGEMLREHFARCLERFEPKSLLYLGAGVGNGLEYVDASTVRDLLAVDVNPEYLEVLRRRVTAPVSLRTAQCSFPEDFEDSTRFQLVYGALFFEYVDLEPALIAVAGHLAPGGHLVALLQQPSEEGHVTETGVTSLHGLAPIMSLHHPRSFISASERVGRLGHISTQHLSSPCGKPFCEIVLRRT